jgi:hypothetical protein
MADLPEPAQDHPDASQALLSRPRIAWPTVGLFVVAQAFYISGLAVLYAALALHDWPHSPHKATDAGNKYTSTARVGSHVFQAPLILRPGLQQLTQATSVALRGLS